MDGLVAAVSQGVSEPLSLTDFCAWRCGLGRAQLAMMGSARSKPIRMSMLSVLVFWESLAPGREGGQRSGFSGRARRCS